MSFLDPGDLRAKIQTDVFEMLKTYGKLIQLEGRVVCRVLPSSRYGDGVHIQWGRLDGYRKTQDFVNHAEAASFLQGILEALKLTGVIITTEESPL